MNILEIINLSYFNNKMIIDDINLNIENGKIYSIIGNNNCGKTTLIKLISGLIPTTDNIRAVGIPLNRKNVSNYIVNFGVVLSRLDNQFLFANVYDELSFPLKNLGFSKNEINNRINDVLEEFKMSNYMNANIIDLTLSEKQKLLIIIALIHNPKILVMDDPFNMINNKETLLIMQILNKKCQDGNLTVIFTTNNLNDTLYTDKILVMDSGKIVFNGDKFDVLKEDQLLLKLGLEIPFIIDLSIKLKFYNLIDRLYVGVEDLVNALWK